MTDSVSFELTRADLFRAAAQRLFKPRLLLTVTAAMFVAALPRLEQGVLAYILYALIPIIGYHAFVAAVLYQRAPRSTAFGVLGKNRVTLEAAGYRADGPGVASFTRWQAVEDISIGARDVQIKFDSVRARPIPRHAFASREQLEAFVTRARELRAQAAPDQPLPGLLDDAPLAQAQFELNRALAYQGLRESTFANRRLRITWVATALFVAWLDQSESLSLIFMFVSNLVVLAVIYRIFLWLVMRGTLRAISDRSFGPRTLELGVHGVSERIAVGSGWVAWRHVSVIRETKNFVIMTAGNDNKIVPKASFQSATGAADFAQLARKLRAEAASTLG